MTAGRVKEITALSNPIIKELRSLAQKKHREREHMFLTEGLKLVLEGLETGAKIRYLLYAGARAEQNALLEQAAARAYAAGALVIKANQKIMEAVCRRDNAQNIVGVFESRWHSAEAVLAGQAKRAPAAATAPIRFNPAPAAANSAETERRSGQNSSAQANGNNSQNSGGAQASGGGQSAGKAAAARIFLALDRVRDPGNLGTIIRTADAVGADGLILVGETTSPFAAEAVRATMGSIFALPLARITEEAFLPLMRRFRGLTVGAHLKGAADYRSIAYFSAAKGKKPAADAFGQAEDVLLLLGNEQKGLTETLAENCDILARIPQTGRADSLNLAVSAAVMLFEICRPRLKL